MSDESQPASTTPRLALTIPALTGGGAERALVTLANHWAELGCRVTLITLDSVRRDAYALDPRIERVGLDVSAPSRGPFRALGNNLKRLWALRRALRSATPEVIVTFLDQMNVLTLLASRGLGARVIIAERTNPQRHQVGRAWSLLRRVTYPRCGALVVQTHRAREQMGDVVRNRPILVIPNGIAAPQGCRDEDPSRDERTIVAMGRLAPEKRFDLLIEAFARIARQHPAWRLIILGEGPERSNLQRTIAESGLAGRVQLPGWTAEPQAVLQASDLFVLSSRYEGFPNALLEAMACGLPAISFDCPNGPDEIIRNGVDGLLVPEGDVIALAAALDRLMSSDLERRSMSHAARDVCERFSLEAFFDGWDQLVLKGAAEQDERTPRARP